MITGGLDFGSNAGLSDQEAAEILAQEGFNELPSSKPRSIWAVGLSVLREPIFLLLIAGGAIYLVLGDIYEALLLLGFVFVVMGITFFEERKTENALGALRNLSSPRARVVRGGAEKRIAGRDVVRGDIMLVAEGDRVAADGILLAVSNLMVDESLLTGESVPVRKVNWDGREDPGQPGGDAQPFIYSGTMVVSGQGAVQIRKTGVNTQLGKIGSALASIETTRTPLQIETDHLVRNMGVVGISLCIVVALVFGYTRSDWLGGILAGITLAMAVLPEEFGVVLTVFLALGAWRISKRGVLTRRIPSIEALGSATVLCVDKTGTLTQNKMCVAELYEGGEFFAIGADRVNCIPETFHPLVEYCVLASAKDPFDPMERAFQEFGVDVLGRTEHLHSDWNLLREYPLTGELLAMSQVWRSQDGIDYIIASKGAPEAIIDLCHLDESHCKTVLDAVAHMADEGLRVIGVAKASFSSNDGLPQDQHSFGFAFLGLIGLADPLRASVPDAVKECYEAGIRVVMITGDYSGTARSIAEQAGLQDNDVLLTGPELDKIPDVDLPDRIRAVNIFARAVPEQKLRLVQALKANGEVVAMTGDGVNDAPALKASAIGIAMGARGTDVAREAADLVLLDDDFSSIVAAIRLGRRIFDNLRKAMIYILAIHVPIAGLSLIPVLLKWPLILLPIHVVFLELIIDPACSIVFEAQSEESNVMNRPPRNMQVPILDRKMLFLSLYQGIGVLVVGLLVFGINLGYGISADTARTMTFTALIIANLGLILTNLTWSGPMLSALKMHNRALWWVVGGALAFLALVLYVPFLRELFKFSKLGAGSLMISLVVGALNIVWCEIMKTNAIRKEG